MCCVCGTDRPVGKRQGPRINCGGERGELWSGGDGTRSGSYAITGVGYTCVGVACGSVSRACVLRVRDTCDEAVCSECGVRAVRYIRTDVRGMRFKMPSATRHAAATRYIRAKAPPRVPPSHLRPLPPPPTSAKEKSAVYVSQTALSAVPRFVPCGAHTYIRRGRASAYLSAVIRPRHSSSSPRLFGGVCFNFFPPALSRHRTRNFPGQSRI